MPFPESQRVIYGKNPLEQVISQLRFPTILKIEAELPAEFQERLRRDYPVFDPGGDALVPEGVPPEISRLFANLATGATRVYGFASADGIWRVSLNRDFIALTCAQYTRWDEFRGRLDAVLEHVADIYAPSYLIRIGLRYRNVIDRDRLGLAAVPWSELFHSYLAAELASNMAELVQQNGHQVVVALPNRHGTVRIVHGLKKRDAGGKDLYVIDNDFFTDQRVELKDAKGKLDQFNHYSGGLFRYFIENRLHRAMGPTNP